MSARSASVLHGSGDRPYSRNTSDTSALIFSRSWLVALRKSGEKALSCNLLMAPFSVRAIRFAKSKFLWVLRCCRWNHSAGKLQTPSSKLQRSSKPQTSMRRPRMVTHRSGLGLELEIWSFSGAWSLEFGVGALVRFWVERFPKPDLRPPPPPS